MCILSAQLWLEWGKITVPVLHTSLSNNTAGPILSALISLGIISGSGNLTVKAQFALVK